MIAFKWLEKKDIKPKEMKKLLSPQENALRQFGYDLLDKKTFQELSDCVDPKWFLRLGWSDEAQEFFLKELGKKYGKEVSRSVIIELPTTSKAVWEREKVKKC